MRKYVDGSNFDFGSDDKPWFGGPSSYSDAQNDVFNFLPDPDVPTHVSLQVHATTTSSSSPGQVVNGTSTITDVDYHWDGITFAQSGGYYPPDNALAAGANVVITAENDAIQITTLQGTSPQTESLNTFFGSVMSSGYFLADARVLYDVVHHQFIVTVDEVNNSLTTSSILMAVSNSDLTTTSLSSANWQFQAASTTYNINGITTWADQPLVAVDGHNIYVSTNQFSASGTYEGSVLTVFDDGLFTGSHSNFVSATAYAAPSYQTAEISGRGTYYGEYLIANTHNSLSIFESVGGVNSTPVTVSLGNIDFGNGAYSASQYGTRYKLDAGDGRITSAAYDSANQKLYVVFEGQPSSSKAPPSVEWVQLDMHDFNSTGGATAPTVLHAGNLNSLLPTTGATAGAATFNGSVAVDGNGDVLFNFNVSGSHMYAADYFTFWKGAGSATATTTPNFVAPTDYHDSVAAYVDPAHDLVGRWGDYSTATFDPAHANGFYLSNEFDNGKVLGYSSWSTSVDHILV
ncbi:hypothetical protein [Bradyrhizobium neotropicale]|uniref:Uncharacterized protein n=1 Tax=Bradyrhizobium neotropicale TaxID=1497615 RepID=A0A176YL14_9BRAD|nr:hypothetical protein [Bradyrhizobium neotropicale]OAF06448.1 hypothetical protein AXW67_32300 [Bradyrhizobium neotropicale]